MQYSNTLDSFSDYPFGMLMPGRTDSTEKYKFGFNGQERSDEIKGVGKHNTALYWEYDTRLGRRLNLDPKTSIGISDYCVMQNSPLSIVDPYGDEVKTDKEGAKIIDDGLKASLPKGKNPIGFDEKAGKLTFDKDMFDANKKDYNKTQIELLDRYSTVIESETDVITVKIVDYDEKIEELEGLRIRDISGGSDGITVNYSLQDKAGNKYTPFQNVYIARNPHRKENEGGQIIYRPGKTWRPGFASIHEIAGHSYMHHTQPMLTKADSNRLVEEFEERIREIYKYKGTAVGGSADPHEE